MNKVFHINLGGYPFTIDEDAYEYLNQYLKAIHNHFKQSEGYEEITSDIEARLAELFQENLAGRTIVTIKDIQNAISVMGRPEDFGADSISEDAHAGSEGQQGSKNEKEYRTGKRLFRDIDDKVVGGVCSGLAAYFGIQDPLWVRLFFVLLAATGGFGIPLYLILLFILPKAITAADKLAMRGAPINVSSIAKQIEEGMEQISQKVNEFGSDLNNKKKVPFSGADARSAIEKGVAALGEAFAYVIYLLGKIFRPLLFLAGGILIISLLATWIGLIVGGTFVFPLAGFLTPGATMASVMAFANVFFLVGIPIISLILLFARFAFRTRISRYWRAGMWSFWLVNLISLGILGVWFGRQFDTSAKNVQNIPLSGLHSDTLEVRFTETPYGDSHNRFGDIRLMGDLLVSEDVHLNIEKSDNGSFELTRTYYSQGIGQQEAGRLAAAIDYQVSNTGNQLNLSPEFALAKSNKWRGQRVELTLKVPVGKFIRLNNEVQNRVSNVDVVENAEFWRSDEHLWRMQADGLSCFDCKQLSENEDGSREKGFDESNFKSIRVEGDMRISVEKGDYYKIRVTGAQGDINAIEVKQSGSTLYISSKEENPSEVIRLYITMPNLESFIAENTDDIKIQGFEEQNLQLSTKGESECKADIKVDNLSIVLDEKATMVLIGSGKTLKASVDDNAKLDANLYEVKTGDVNLFNGEMELNVKDTLRQKVEEGNVRVTGNPVLIKE